MFSSCTGISVTAAFSLHLMLHVKDCSQSWQSSPWTFSCTGMSLTRRLPCDWPEDVCDWYFAWRWDRTGGPALLQTAAEVTVHTLKFSVLCRHVGDSGRVLCARPDGFCSWSSACRRDWSGGTVLSQITGRDDSSYVERYANHSWWAVCLQFWLRSRHCWRQRWQVRKIL